MEAPETASNSSMSGYNKPLDMFGELRYRAGSSLFSVLCVSITPRLFTRIRGVGVFRCRLRFLPFICLDDRGTFQISEPMHDVSLAKQMTPAGAQFEVWSLAPLDPPSESPPGNPYHFCDRRHAQQFFHVRYSFLLLIAPVIGYLQKN
jgi:hypothetical protein